jgi:hypothetical protein
MKKRWVKRSREMAIERAIDKIEAMDKDCLSDQFTLP